LPPPYYPPGLDARELAQPVTTLVQVREAVGTGHPRQLAVRLVGPGVIGADNPLGRYRFLAVNQPCTEVAAEIGEHMRLAVIVTGQDQRCAIAVVRDRLAGFGQQRRRRPQVGDLVKDCALFGFVPVRVDVDARRELLDARPKGSFTAGKGVSQRALARRWASRRTGHVHRQKAAPLPPW